MKKKIGFLVLFLIIPLFILTSCGKDKNDNIEDDPTVEDYNYVCTDTECYLAGINNVDAFFKNLTDEWVVIPSNYNDKPITKINKDAFTITPIVKLKISDNIEVIEESAFRGCYKLNEVILPDTLKLLRSYSFAGCKVESLMIPKNLKTIEEGALACDDLKDVYYNGTIEDWCKIEFEDKNSNPMNYASNFYILDPNGDIEYNGNKYSLVTEIEIPNTITSIGNYQFYGFNNVTSITIPDSVINIGEYSFSYCSSITNLNVLSNVESIGSGAFKGCSSLKGLEIPNGIKTINNSVFDSCSSLSFIVIPKSVKSIGRDTFSGCDLLDDVYYNGTIEDWCKIEFADGNFNNPMLNSSNFHIEVNNPMYYASDFYILDEKGNIEYSGNKYSLVTEIEIPDTITSIVNQLCGFNKVTSIIVPNSVTNIKKYAFSRCNSLEMMSLPFLGESFEGGSLRYFFGTMYENIPPNLKEIRLNGGKIINYGSFDSCGNLETILIPNTITKMGLSAFYGCDKLTSVYYDGSIEDWCKIEFANERSNPMNYGCNFYILDSNGDIEYNGKKYSLVTEIEIPNTITSIGNYQFYGFNNVTSIIIPEGVTSIGKYAFSGCISVRSIEIPSSVENIGFGAFYAFGVNSIKIPNGIEIIDRMVFGNCMLKSIIIPKSVTQIEQTAFYSSILKKVYYEGTLTEWTSIDISSVENSCLIEATIYYYSETMPTEDGNYWHYDENNNVVIWQ